jgi:hypothetical protein
MLSEGITRYTQEPIDVRIVLSGQSYGGLALVPRSFTTSISMERARS